jgi:hypothetical protein
VIPLFIFISFCLFARGSRDIPGTSPTAIADKTELPESINAYFFYEELCGTCHTDIDSFFSILQENLSPAERDRYPHSFIYGNVFENQGRSLYVQVTDDLGLDRDLLETPLLIIGGRVFQGYDSIKTNIREAYLTAAEDLYVYKRPYNPRTRKTGNELFDDYPIVNDHAALVYFYRTTCPECAQVTPIIDALPGTVSVNGRERPLEIIRINTRSGNNSERVAAFFEAWQVPDQDRMVPIVFFSDSYLAGFEAISGELRQNLSRNPIPWRLLPERK